jgi:hypothetical protein
VLGRILSVAIGVVLTSHPQDSCVHDEVSMRAPVFACYELVVEAVDGGCGTYWAWARDARRHRIGLAAFGGGIAWPFGRSRRRMPCLGA